MSDIKKEYLKLAKNFIGIQFKEIKHQEFDVNIKSSFMGAGKGYVPDGFEVPEGKSIILQINFDDIDHSHLPDFPKTGILQIWSAGTDFFEYKKESIIYHENSNLPFNKDYGFIPKISDTNLGEFLKKIYKKGNKDICQIIDEISIHLKAVSSDDCIEKLTAFQSDEFSVTDDYLFGRVYRVISEHGLICELSADNKVQEIVFNDYSKMLPGYMCMDANEFQDRYPEVDLQDEIIDMSMNYLGRGNIIDGNECFLNGYPEFYQDDIRDPDNKEINIIQLAGDDALSFPDGIFHLLISPSDFKNKDFSSAYCYVDCS
jgi:uncharacterized protein YwqG